MAPSDQIPPGLPLSGASENPCPASCDPGPFTRASSRFVSGRPSPVQTAPAAAQPLVAGSTITTSAADAGATVTPQRWFDGRFSRRAPVTAPPVTSNAPSSSVR